MPCPACARALQMAELVAFLPWKVAGLEWEGATSAASSATPTAWRLPAYALEVAVTSRAFCGALLQIFDRELCNRCPRSFVVTLTRRRTDCRGTAREGGAKLASLLVLHTVDRFKYADAGPAASSATKTLSCNAVPTTAVCDSWHTNSDG